MKNNTTISNAKPSCKKALKWNKPCSRCPERLHCFLFYTPKEKEI